LHADDSIILNVDKKGRVLENKITFADATIRIMVLQDSFGGLVVSMLASVSQACGFWCKNPQHAFLRRGS
jgi:hypothetical protein